MVKRKDLNKILTGSLNFLSEKIDIECAVLFGSYVSGTPDEYSDIDLAVFSKTIRDWTLEEKFALINSLKDLYPLVELHLYSDEDLREARPTNFYGHILKTGKKVA